MPLLLGNGHSDVPRGGAERDGIIRKEIGRASANYHPSVWGDHFLQITDEEITPEKQQRAQGLKEEVKNMFGDNNDLLHDLNLVNEIQRLGVAYHFENEIRETLKAIFDGHTNPASKYCNNLHAVALRFRLLRQHGYNVSSDLFRKFKDNEGHFKATLSTDISGLLSLYEAAYHGTHGDDILDEAIAFTTENLKQALPSLSSPFSDLVKLALELPLRKRVERLQSRLYISIYEKDTEKNDVLLEFAKLDYSMVQALHRRELRDLSRWWKERDFARKLPFIRDRLVECYFWILGVYYEPHYSRARRMMATMISLTSIMDDIYDVHGTLEELEVYTAALERWDRGALGELPEYLQVHFAGLLDAVDQFEDELRQEEKSYRISYLKEAFKGVARGYLQEARWVSSGFVPAYKEYMEVALLTSAYPMLTVISLVGMGDIVTKEVLEWAISIPKVVTAISIICRLRDDITSSELEQERNHVASAMECYMTEHGISYAESCKRFREMVDAAWKDVNKECLEPMSAPMPVMMRAVNLARVIEVLYMNQDSYTNSSAETKGRIGLLLVDPLPF